MSTELLHVPSCIPDPQRERAQARGSSNRVSSQSNKEENIGDKDLRSRDTIESIEELEDRISWRENIPGNEDGPESSTLGRTMGGGWSGTRATSVPTSVALVHHEKRTNLN